MALHSKWVNGELVFYDGTLEIFTIPESTGAVAFGSTGGGCGASAYYAGSTGTVGVSSSGSRTIATLTIVNGIVTAYTT